MSRNITDIFFSIEDAKKGVTYNMLRDIFHVTQFSNMLPQKSVFELCTIVF